MTDRKRNGLVDISAKPATKGVIKQLTTTEAQAIASAFGTIQQLKQQQQQIGQQLDLANAQLHAIWDECGLAEYSIEKTYQITQNKELVCVD